jgi:myo-inositol-1(or 4)-monophosphatase
MLRRQNSKMSETAYLHIMKKAAGKAAPNIIRDFGEIERLQNSKKNLNNFVSISRQKAAERIVNELSFAKPEFAVICEEIEKEGPLPAAGTYTWLVNPINGVANYTRGIPNFVTNIALMKGVDIISGIIYDHLRDNCFKAECGNGAFIGNHDRLRVSGRESISDSLIALYTSQEMTEDLRQKGAQIRLTGSLSMDLAYLAAGKYDCVIAHDVPFIDVASGIIIIRESGGLLEFSQKNNSTNCDIIAASSSSLLKLLIRKDF